MRILHYSSAQQPSDTQIYSSHSIQQLLHTFPPRPLSCNSFLIAPTLLSIMSEGARTWQPAQTHTHYPRSFATPMSLTSFGIRQCNLSDPLNTSSVVNCAISVQNTCKSRHLYQHLLRTYDTVYSTVYMDYHSGRDLCRGTGKRHRPAGVLETLHAAS